MIKKAKEVPLALDVLGQELSVGDTIVIADGGNRRASYITFGVVTYSKAKTVRFLNIGGSVLEYVTSMVPVPEPRLYVSTYNNVIKSEKVMKVETLALPEPYQNAANYVMENKTKWEGKVD